MQRARATCGMLSPARPSGYPPPSQRSWWCRTARTMSWEKSGCTISALAIGMTPELGRLLVGQAAGLVEHVVGDADAAHVVQEGRLGDLLEPVRRPAELAAEQQHVGGHARGVADGVVVTRIERRDQRLEVGDVHRLDGLVQTRVLEGQREEGADALQDFAVGAGERILLRRSENERAGERVVDEHADEQRSACSRRAGTSADAGSSSVRSSGDDVLAA